MKIYRAPTTAPAIADPLVIDPAELAQIQLYADAKGVFLWFDYRTKKDGTREPHARYYVAQAIKKFRATLAKTPPASRPLLRLEEWQIASSWLDSGEIESAELARRVRQQKALVKMLCTYDPRWHAASENYDRLCKEAAVRFSGLFAPALTALAA